MDDTPNLGLPYIMAAQSQKHVTHNEAIRALDAIVQLAVLDRDLGAPPGAPAEGARYIVGDSPTGAWSGHSEEIAAYQDGAWMFYAPHEGWIAWVADEEAAVVWSGSSWTALTTGGGEGTGGEGDFDTLGINATADTTNRLAVSAAATLFYHDGDDHRLKINKADAGDTASIVYQNAFSGRAELGLAGDDDFHFKVSADGSSWKEAILIDRSTGSVSFPFTSLGGGGGGREMLTANRTYYVRTNGSDSNDGLANTSGGAFLTLQKAYDVIAATLDLAGHTVTVQIADGTYTAGLTIAQPWSGGGAVTFTGNAGTPSNVVVNPTAATCYNTLCPLPGVLTIANQKLTTTTSGHGIYMQAPGTIHFSALVFGSLAGSYQAHLYAEVGGANIVATGNYTIDGTAGAHVYAVEGGRIAIFSRTVTLSGTPGFGDCFVSAARLGVIMAHDMTFTGSATGKRFDASNGGLLFTSGASTSYFPGSSAGTGTNFGTSPYGRYA
ncbi:MAG: DUF2793 domain-containing protein [Hyphomicrobium sp.]